MDVVAGRIAMALHHRRRRRRRRQRRRTLPISYVYSLYVPNRTHSTSVRQPYESKGKPRIS